MKLLSIYNKAGILRPLLRRCYYMMRWVDLRLFPAGARLRYDTAVGFNKSPTEAWKGGVGQKYTDKITVPWQEADSHHKKWYGISKMKLNELFIGQLPLGTKILEVGCNAGNQLLTLQAMGFTDLSGIELQEYALLKAKERCKGIKIQQGNIQYIPHPDKSFDLVFTAGVLAHIHREDLPNAFRELYRVTRKYIWCYETYSSEYQAIDFALWKNLWWKGDYAKMMLSTLPVKLLKQTIYPQIGRDDRDNSMFLLERQI